MPEVSDGSADEGMLCEGDVDYVRVPVVAGEEVEVDLRAPYTVALDVFADDGVELLGTGGLVDGGRTVSTFAAETGSLRVRLTNGPGEAAARYVLAVHHVAGRRFFVRPDGDDGAAGDVAAPWQTLERSVGALEPGDTLVVEPGVFPRSSGPLHVDCPDGARDGEPDAPIRVVALRERQARVERVIRMEGCAHWRIEGLFIDGADDPDSSVQASGIELRDVDDVVLRRMLFAHSNRFMNAHTVSIEGSRDVLVEESEVYWYHRVAFFVFDSERVVIRRNYSNSRGYPTIVAGDPIYPSGTATVDGFASSTPDRGDDGVLLWKMNGPMLVENHVDEGSDVGVAGESTASGHGIFGCATIGSRFGFTLVPGSGGDEHRSSSIVNSLALHSELVGFYVRSVTDAHLEGCSAIDNGDYGFVVDMISGGVMGSLSARNCLAAHNAGGFRVAEQSSWEVRTSDAWDNGVDLNPAGSPSWVGVLSEDPELGSCAAYLPPGSPMRGRGDDGADIGADLSLRYRDGEQTSVPLFESDDGAVPVRRRGARDQRRPGHELHRGSRAARGGSCRLPDPALHPSVTDAEDRCVEELSEHALGALPVELGIPREDVTGSEDAVAREARDER